MRWGVVPLFYFHLFNEVTCMDDEGLELADQPVAMQKATMLAREMAADSVRNGRLVLSHRIEVADESGATIGTVHFGDTVEVRD